MSPKKHLTRQIPLRMNDAERALLEEVQRVYGEAGVEMSLNDTLRHLLRRAGIVLAHTPDESAAQIREHCEGCEHCELEADRYGCPEGLYLSRNHRRVLRAYAGSMSAAAL
jgi:hypothetical protein